MMKNLQAPLRMKLPPGFPTKKSARIRKEQLIKRLAARGYPIPPPMKECVAHRRCWSAACPVCGWLFRLHQHKQAHAAGLHQLSWVRVVIIPEGMLVPVDELRYFDFAKRRRAVIRQAQRAVEKHFPGAIVIGGFDVSLNTHENRPVGYQFHLYLLVATDDAALAEKVFKKFFTPEPTAYRPYSVKAVEPDAFAQALSYSYKDLFSRRSSYWDCRTKLDGGSRTNTKTQWLSPGEESHLAAWMADKRTDFRFVGIGIQRWRSPEGKPRFKPHTDPA